MKKNIKKYRYILGVLVLGGMSIFVGNDSMARQSTQASASTCGVSYNNISHSIPKKEIGGIEVPYLVGDDILGTKLTFTVDGENSSVPGANIDIVFVMDKSGSMSGTKIRDAKNALIASAEFVENFSGENRIGLVSFSSSSYVNARLTNDIDQVKGSINRLSAGGGTSIGGGLKTGAKELKDNGRSDTRQFIVLASDGQHNTSPSVQAGISTVSSNVTVYTIGIGSGADENELRRIATQAGNGQGEYFFGSSSDLNAIFQDILEDIVYEFKMTDVKVTFEPEETYAQAIATNPSTPKQGGKYTWELTDPIGGNDIAKDFFIDYKAMGNTGGIKKSLSENDLIVEYTLFEGTSEQEVCRDVIAINKDEIEIMDKALVLAYGSCNGTRIGNIVPLGIHSSLDIASCNQYQGLLGASETAVENATWNFPGGCINMNQKNTSTQTFSGRGVECERDLTVSKPSYDSASTVIKAMEGGGGTPNPDIERGIWKEVTP